MEKELGIVFIHGIGEDQDKAASAFMKRAASLQDRIESQLGPAKKGCILYKAIVWQDVVQGRQSQVFENVENASVRTDGIVDSIIDRLRPNWLIRTGLRLFRKTIERLFPKALTFGRRLLVSTLGDAAVFEYKAVSRDSAYTLIQRRIRDGLWDIYREADNRPIPLIVIAHSFGAHLISNYLWDARGQAKSQAGASADSPATGIWRYEPLANFPTSLTDFLRFGSLECFFSTGCNIALFLSGLKDIEPIPRPNDRFQWISFWSPNDVLGWPLKALTFDDHDPARPYEEMVDREYSLDMRGVYTHDKYWDQQAFQKELSEAIDDILSGGDGASLSTGVAAVASEA